MSARRRALLNSAVEKGNWGDAVAALARLMFTDRERGATLQATSVLDFEAQYDEMDVNAGVHFNQPDMDAGRKIVISHETWASLGHPNYITVTVVAGDELNG